MNFIAIRYRKVPDLGRALAGTLAAIALGVAAGAHAQPKSYPDRPVRTLVPLSAGGSMDTIMRNLSAKLGESFGQTFVVDNRPGAGSLVAMDILASAAPDGHTLMAVGATTVVYPLLYKSRYELRHRFRRQRRVNNQHIALRRHLRHRRKIASDVVA